MYTGRVVTALTARVTAAADFGSVPKAMPPWDTLGQDTFTSMMPTPSCASILAQVSAYSSMEKPDTLAITGLWKNVRRCGSSWAIT